MRPSDLSLFGKVKKFRKRADAFRLSRTDLYRVIYGIEDFFSASFIRKSLRKATEKSIPLKSHIFPRLRTTTKRNFAGARFASLQNSRFSRDSLAQDEADLSKPVKFVPSGQTFLPFPLFRKLMFESGEIFTFRGTTQSGCRKSQLLLGFLNEHSNQRRYNERLFCE